MDKNHFHITLFDLNKLGELSIIYHFKNKKLRLWSSSLLEKRKAETLSSRPDVTGLLQYFC